MRDSEAIVPDKATMEHTIILSTESKSKKYIEGVHNLLKIAMHVLLFYYYSVLFKISVCLNHDQWVVSRRLLQLLRPIRLTYKNLE